jgi:hypothetical protein
LIKPVIPGLRRAPHFPVIPGRAKREPGISRFRVWSFGPSRNDGGKSKGGHADILKGSSGEDSYAALFLITNESSYVNAHCCFFFFA